MAEFIIPSFLQNHSTNENHKKMKDILPADLDMSEGSHAWNLTRPTALLTAELCEFILPEVIKLIFPEHSYGVYLDNHAKARGMMRREATAAMGELTIYGTLGTVIPAGSVFSTASVNDEPSVDYEAVAEYIIPQSGTITVQVRCKQPGIIGNTPPNTIIFCSGKITGITSVTNTEAFTGGTETEDDESLQLRVVEYDESQGESNVGNEADYKRWATSVVGVGNATVIPASDDSGVVTIVITDTDGKPATDLLCESVYNYIMRPDNRPERLAPVNAILSVVPPTAVPIGIRATVEIQEGFTIESIKLSYFSKINAYLSVAAEEGEIKYSKVYSALSETDGVNDISSLNFAKDNGLPILGMSNIQLEPMSIPVISANDIELTSV